MFVRAQMSRALYSDVEAWDERRQTQPIQDADAEIQDSHGTDSRRESPGPILDLGLSSRPRDLRGPTGGRRFTSSADSVPAARYRPALPASM